jgi:polysaccharide biosynthesis PFTS motif protein
LKRLSKKNNVTLLDPSIGVQNVIENTIATISIPYTSTGIVAALKEKPSVYFDPLNLLEYDTDVSHGLPLLQSKQALEEWVKSIANKSQPKNRDIEINK